MSSFFLQGFWYFLTMPSHIVVLLGLGLLLGQQAIRGLKIGLPAFALALAAGLLLTQTTLFVWNLELVLLTLAVVIGGLLALRLELPAWALGLLSGIAGILIGMDSAPSLIPGMKAIKVYAEIAGTWLGSSLAVLLPALPALLLRLPLDGVILRVLGSWVAASALMVVALAFIPR